MKFLLDSNACIELIRPGRSPGLRRRVKLSPPGSVVVCSIVRSELVFGSHRSQNAAASLERVHEFMSGFISLTFDDAAADRAGALRAQLAAQRTTIGPNDLLIAAIALASDLTLITHNTREFARVPGLRIEDWQLDAAGAS